MKNILSKLSFWRYDEYEEINYPLAFVPLPVLMPTDIVNVLCWFDVMYGNTDQNTSTWALEFQLLTRMLVHDKALLINPKHLAMEDVEKELYDVLPASAYTLYMQARLLTQDQIAAAFAAQEDI